MHCAHRIWEWVSSAQKKVLGVLPWSTPPPRSPPHACASLQERVTSKCLPVIADKGVIVDGAAIVVEYIEAK